MKREMNTHSINTAHSVNDFANVGEYVVRLLTEVEFGVSDLPQGEDFLITSKSIGGNKLDREQF